MGLRNRNQLPRATKAHNAALVWMRERRSKMLLWRLVFGLSLVDVADCTFPSVVVMVKSELKVFKFLTEWLDHFLEESLQLL